MNNIFINHAFKLKLIFSIFCISSVLSVDSFAQKTDGTVSSLIKMETYFNDLVAKKGLNNAFMEVATKNGVVFKPNPLNIIDYYSKQTPADFELGWQPDFAMIAKSGYFGFTTGLYTVKKDEKISYGHFLSVWKAESNKKWQLALDAGISHKKPVTEAEPLFIDPSNYKYPKLIGPKKIKMREDIVFSTDLLFGKALKNTGNKNFNEYYADNVRLYFPGQLPLLGKRNAIAFIDERNQHVTSYPTFTDRAISGDLAYTNGKANIGVNKYNYIRIWQIGEDMKWYILVDMYLEE
ncbi:MAG TPA: hypothetical protein VL125_08100 [Pelobium sp.]|nr:hypothetical protein [Pelobium sp.]